MRWTLNTLRVGSMAQHMTVLNGEGSRLVRKAVESIKKEVAKGLQRTSNKWNLDSTDENGMESWHTVRYVGSGVVFGDTKALFEVHKIGNEIKELYLVA